jgi:CMP/dCMP kinase
MTTAPHTVPFVVAIDGPAGSGKTTTARDLARALGFVYVDTGAMYRAVALHVLRSGARVDDAEAVCGLLPGIDIRLEINGHMQRTLLGGEDVEDAIRTQDIARAASDVSAIPCVREAMVDMQRRAVSATTGAVLEGRDIGTVVFPDAPCKIFLVADAATRARRRMLQLAERGVAGDHVVILREIEERDRNDATRAHSPLRKAADAIEVETTNTSIDEQVAMILTLVRWRLAQQEGGAA